jgi:cell division protein FtsA
MRGGELQQAGLHPQIRDGVILAGGCARIPDIQKMASRVFGLPAQLGHANSIGGLKSALDQPEFATGIGLARYGSFEWKKRQSQRATLGGGLKQTLNQLFRFAGTGA